MRKAEKWSVTILVLTIGILCLQTTASAGGPDEVIQSVGDRVFEVLKDPQYANARDKMEEKLWEIVYPVFDFEEMSQRSLAVHWRNRTPAEKEEFVDLFGRLLYQSYVNKIEQYNDEKVVITDQKTAGTRAVISTKVVGSSMEIPIDYKLHNKDNGWRIYDVAIEGVSLVNNYRNQFNKIVVSSGYEELIKRMKTKWRDLVAEKDDKKK